MLCACVDKRLVDFVNICGAAVYGCGLYGNKFTGVVSVVTSFLDHNTK